MKGSGDRTLRLRATGQSELKKKCEKGVPIETDTIGTKGEEQENLSAFWDFVTQDQHIVFYALKHAIAVAQMKECIVLFPPGALLSRTIF